ncbi:hypothetical protein FACS189441_7470 [Betaproteobacteria bacterium]|nr:hypothetical protein FACS189441_7470 [Betaproteobacteria bacterium]
MEKGKPHYLLESIKDVVRRTGIAAFTNTAVSGARKMGLTDEEVIDVVLALSSRQFFKSMTTHVDHRVWQDVYHTPCPGGKIAYVKLTLRDGAVVIQFKEK